MSERTPLIVPLVSHSPECADDVSDDDEFLEISRIFSRGNADGYSLAEAYRSSFSTTTARRSVSRRRSINSPTDDDDITNDDDGGRGGATVLQTSLNVAKICTGTGTLALPYASEVGGQLFNAIGLFAMGAWNYYSANCLLRCAECPPTDHRDPEEFDDDFDDDGPLTSTRRNRPPPGMTAYGRVAWRASGPVGVTALDSLMLSVFVGIVIACEVAMMSFIDGTPLTTGSRRLDLLIPNAVLIALSCAPDVGFLGRYSGIGLAALAASFAVISWQGFRQNGCDGFRRPLVESDLWPETISAASSWFGVVMFSFGVVPFVLNFR